MWAVPHGSDVQAICMWMRNIDLKEGSDTGMDFLFPRMEQALAAVFGHAAIQKGREQWGAIGLY